MYNKGAVHEVQYTSEILVMSPACGHYRCSWVSCRHCRLCDMLGS